MSTEEDLVKHLDEINIVVGEYLKGNDATKISKDLAIPRTRVVQHINEWKVMASANDAIRARAKEALAVADTHYNKLISKSYEVIDEAMLQIEKKQEVLMAILRDIASEHPEIRDEIMRRLSDIAKKDEVITIVHEV